MSTVQTAGQAKEINGRAGHWLFVEGKDNEAFDPVVLKALLANDLPAVNVRALGSCEDIRQAAKAMVHMHPSYYFLIDRDGRSHDFVSKSWSSFPDLTTYNLLVWRRRELENYFLDPSYLKASQYLVISEDELAAKIQNNAQQRLFLDAANLVLLELRDELMRPPEAAFRQPEQFQDRSTALAKLLGCQGLAEKKSETARLVEPSLIESRFDTWLDRMSDGRTKLEYGYGQWLELMSGKEMFNAVVNEAFKVKKIDGSFLTGKDKNKEVVRKLLELPLHLQPQDFQELVNLIKRRVG
ncbi:MAG: hypothetical protein ACOYOF_19215 [Verrucomicrobiaceae bacterium]